MIEFLNHGLTLYRPVPGHSHRARLRSRVRPLPDRALNGVRVEVFSIGFGPEVFGWCDRAGTRWKFSTIPLGGYVKMFGDSDASSGLPVPGLARLAPAERDVSFITRGLASVPR